MKISHKAFIYLLFANYFDISFTPNENIHAIENFEDF